MNPKEYLLVPLEGVSTKLKLPYVIGAFGGYTLQLRKISQKEASNVFRIKIINGDVPGSYSIIPIGATVTPEYQDIGESIRKANIALYVVPTPDEPLLNESLLERSICFALRCAIGLYVPYFTWVDDDREQSKIVYRGIPHAYFSAVQPRMFTKVAGEDINKLLSSNVEGPLSHKFRTLQALLNSATMQAGSRDVSCVLYISILEAIYVQDNQELAYKLSMRLARKMSKNNTFAKSIRTLYTKRGKVIHGSQKGEIFTEEDQITLESIAKRSLIDFVNQPDEYSEIALDSLLLA